MYSELVSIQILIGLLKKHGICNIVISAGQSNKSFADSVEHDDFFKCYSVVDERSAAFFAIGLSIELGETVAISCTASTACCNYLSAITEAYYRELPILVLTSNYDIRKVDQMKLLAIHQESIFRDVCKMEVQLPDVSDKRYFNYCERLVNEALLELNHHGKGPVHIDIPTYGRRALVNVENLPIVRKIDRFDCFDDWNSLAKNLAKKKIMLMCGQGDYSDECRDDLLRFSEKYKCVLAGEHFANIHVSLKNIGPIITNYLKHARASLMPDIIVTIGKHVQFDWSVFEGYGVEHWTVNEGGKVVDNFGGLTKVFEATPERFLCKMNESDVCNTETDYLELWENLNIKTIPDISFSNVYAIGELLKRLPKESVLNLSILNSIRIAQYFEIPNSVRVYANMGALGIDGSMSTFIGQSVHVDNLSFLVIGDLSFFYDMNSLMIRHIGNNVRILLINNNGGAEFYQNNGWYDTIDRHTAARHSHTAQGWAEENGFIYHRVDNKEDLLRVMNEFVEPSAKPMLVEVVSDMQNDSDALKCLYKINEISTSVDVVRNTVKRGLGDKGISFLKKIIDN